MLYFIGGITSKPTKHWLERERKTIKKKQLPPGFQDFRPPKYVPIMHAEKYALTHFEQSLKTLYNFFMHAFVSRCVTVCVYGCFKVKFAFAQDLMS